ncbi:zinc-dependent alcohol dehydrogenase family protein [Clostridium formicaceticum]|uniref:Chlorophyll synthesis pathway protein BchC n=1 Tax=Clostridium formicaceticum TaxID=1497 RepID=A0AAC9WIN3_9CLOT|nr:zinc-dependent alcohol dehydrogenase family protein [Clostridium formicaceticum]AOY74495.1 chlorophyll synthesis pathway protein BchC [Clostridium formicaceticum]ARE88845.1 L-threonine 3-dehydrogenase [Clostridium formicaceticum]
MKALVYTEPRNFNIMEVDTPACKENQVLIKVAACGICKTDVHIHNGQFLSKFPLTPGHEFTGVVEAVGSKVTAFKKGDRVVADNTVLCGECYYCRRNQPLYCENFHSLGVTGPGGFAEYVIVNQDKVFGISDGLSFDIASFAEPTACAVHGMDRIDVQNGDNVLMFGAGPTGIILAQLLKYGGAGNIVVAAPSKFKLDILEELGIAETVVIDKQDESVHEEKIKSMYPKGFDIIIDATGAASVTQSCFKYAKKGSKIVIYGVCDEADRISISPYEIFANEYKIIGSFAQTHCFDRAINALEKGIVKVDKLISHRFSLDEYAKGLDTVISGKQSIKVLIQP